MKPFKATYTPVKTIVEGGYHITYQPEPEKARTVFIVAFQDGAAIFIDGDNTLREDDLNCFTNCQMDWWER